MPTGTTPGIKLAQSQFDAAHDSRQIIQNHTSNSNADHLNMQAPETSTDAAPLELQESRAVAVFIESDRIAFAAYDESTNEIILGDYRAHGHDTEDVIIQFYSDIQPSILLMNHKIAGINDLLNVLTRADCEAEGIKPIPYKLLKSTSFDVRNARHLILTKLNVLTLTKRLDHQINHPVGRSCSSFHGLASIINFDSSVLVRAIGGLLSYLQATIFQMEEGQKITISNIRQATPRMHMSIDSITLQNLHIFATEHHPLLAKGQGNSKEGFSLFTLLDRCKSRVGRARLREWMVKPLLDVDEISSRQDGVELFLCPDCAPAVQSVLGFLQKIGAIDKIILRMQKCVTAANDFLVLSKTLSAGISICSILFTDLMNYVNSLQNTELQEGTNSTNSFSIRSQIYLQRLLEKCDINVLRKLHQRITSIIDVDITAEAKDSIIIHFGFHEELDTAKEALERLDETLNAVGVQVLNKYPTLGQLKVVFLPQVGFLVSLDKRMHPSSIATNEFSNLPQEFIFIFTQDDEIFFKNPDMKLLDQEIGDLDAFIKDTESMIVSNLEDEILGYELEIRRTFEALAELDCIIAFASCAADLNFVRPEVVDSTESPIVYISNGRHPLQEIIVENGSFIPNDTMIDDMHRLNVITGPNFSGKSCYTRQVGVLVYMAHIGCFLPCDRAKISITDQILARISNVETCAIPQSSFQLDLTQMATVLRRATSRSLCLIDEFGKGTAPASGIAVLTAALRKLSRVKASVICTTHLLEIFSLGLLKDNNDGTKALRMAIHVPEANDNPIPLFKLELGIAESSAGLVCAKLAGVPEKVISRAKDILNAMKENKPIQPISESVAMNSTLQPNTCAALRTFLSVDSWINASPDDLRQLQYNITMM